MLVPPCTHESAYSCPCAHKHVPVPTNALMFVPDYFRLPTNALVNAKAWLTRFACVRLSSLCRNDHINTCKFLPHLPAIPFQVSLLEKCPHQLLSKFLPVYPRFPDSGNTSAKFATPGMQSCSTTNLAMGFQVGHGKLPLFVIQGSQN